MISPQSLAKASSRHPWLTVGMWLVAVLAAVVLSGALLADALTTDMSYTNNPEAKRAEKIIEDRLRGPDQNMELLIVRSGSRTVDDAAFRAYVEELQRDVAHSAPRPCRRRCPTTRQATPRWCPGIGVRRWWR